MGPIIIRDPKVFLCVFILGVFLFDHSSIYIVGPEGVLTTITITCRRVVEYKYTDFYFLNSLYYQHNMNLQDCCGKYKRVKLI